MEVFTSWPNFKSLLSAIISKVNLAFLRDQEIQVYLIDMLFILPGLGHTVLSSFQDWTPATVSGGGAHLLRHWSLCQNIKSNILPFVSRYIEIQCLYFYPSFCDLHNVFVSGYEIKRLIKNSRKWIHHWQFPRLVKNMTDFRKFATKLRFAPSGFVAYKAPITCKRWKILTSQTGV